MSAVPFVLRLLLVVLLSGTLAACDTAEERAQAHYDRAKSLIAEGEIEKAVVEFRNVFELNGQLVAARLDYANLMLETGDINEAVAHFNLIVEQQPGNIEARRILARVMLQAQRWDIVERHLSVVLKELPDDPELLGLQASLLYRDESTRDQAVALARRVLEADASQISARLVLISSFTDAEKYDEALSEIDTALAGDPEDLQLNLLRLIVLERMGDIPAIGIQLTSMVALFPQNVEVSQALVRWHMGQNDVDAAVLVMRDLAATDPSDNSLAMAYVAFLEQVKGFDAARAELIRLAEGGENASTFRRALALLDYQLGNSDKAFEAARALLSEGGSDREVADAKILIARLEFESGNLEVALPLVEEVLEEDESNVDALVLRAQIAIENERPEGAIQDLRAALNQSPGSPRILTLLAAAHMRNGSNDLARDRLAQAVESSRGGVQESMAYANFLASEGNLRIAEDVLVASLRNQPVNTQLLRALADLRLRREDWDGALEVAAMLREIDPDSQNLSAEAIEISTLSGQKRFGESISRIEAVLEEDSNDRALAALIELYMQSGQTEKAETTLRDALVKDGSNTSASLLLGAVLDADDRGDEAKAVLRRLIEDQPDFRQSYVMLYSLLVASGRLDEAGEVLELGAQATDNAASIQLARASHYERTGDFIAAIEIYDELYKSSPNSLVLANNLASLMSEYLTDKESQDRAFRIARRFRNSDVPAFQDTYGWILFKRESFARALIPLQSAVDGLPENPLVAFHYGMTLAELGKKQKAIEMLEKAVALAGEATNLPQMSEARARIDELKALVAE